MSLPFTKFGLSHLFDFDIDGYTGKLLNYMFDSLTVTDAYVRFKSDKIVVVNSNLTDESLEYIISLTSYSNPNDLLSYEYTNPDMIDYTLRDYVQEYASNNNLEYVAFGSLEGRTFNENPTVQSWRTEEDKDLYEIPFNNDIVEISGTAERRMLLASNFNKPLFCNILRYYISSMVNHNYSKYGTTIKKYIVMNESRTKDLQFPTTFELTNMWHNRSMVKILGPDFVPFFFKAYGDALPPVLKQGCNCLFYGDYVTECADSFKFNRMIDQLSGFRQNGAPIHGFNFQGHFGEIFPNPERNYPRDLRQFESNINYVRINGFNTIVQEFDVRSDFCNDIPFSPQDKLNNEIKFTNMFAHICMNHGVQTFQNWYRPDGTACQAQFLNVDRAPIYGRNNRPTPIFTELHEFVKWYKTNRFNTFNSLKSVFDYRNQYVGKFELLKEEAKKNELTQIKFGIIVDNKPRSGFMNEFQSGWLMDSIKLAFDIIVPPNCMKMEDLRNMNNSLNTDSYNLIQFKRLLGDDFNSNISFGFNGWHSGNINKQLYSNDTNTAANAIANYASNNNLKVRGHTLSWHSQQPKWLINMFNKGFLDSENAKIILSNHVTTVITHYYSRYSNTVTSWDVINELVKAYDVDEEGNAVGSFPRIIGRVETSNDIIINCNCLARALEFPTTQQSIANTASKSEVFRTAFNSAWSATPEYLRNNPSLFYNDFEIKKTTIDYLSNIRGNYRTGNNPFEVNGIAIDGIGFQGYIPTHDDNRESDNVYNRIPRNNTQLKNALSTLYGNICYAIENDFTVDITETVVDKFNAGGGYMYVNYGDYDNELYAKVYRNWLRLCLYAGVNHFISWDHRIFDSNGNPTLYYNEIVKEVKDFPADQYGTRPNFNIISLITME
jgi:GH35 family endo-1,4-beta-xylanase